MRRVLLFSLGLVVSLGVVLLGSSCPALAAEYSVEIRIEDEDDINELYFDGEITEEERDRLLTLYLAKVDLNRATREELYDLPGFTWMMADAVIERRGRPGGIRAVEEIADIPGMTPAVMAQIRPFVIARPINERRRAGVESKTGGIARYAAREQEGGQNTWDPAFYERLRARAYDHAALGLLLTVGYQIGDVRSAPQGGALSAEGYAIRGNVPRFYAMWDGPRLSALVGTYRLGYGLRLTLDTSRKQRPHGIYPNDELYESNDAGKVTPLDGFVGAAVLAKYLPLRRGWFDASAFGSVAYGPFRKDIYSYDFTYDHGSEPFLIDEDTLEPIRYATLPRAVEEWVAGGNVTYNLDRRTALGVTGYYGGVGLSFDAADLRVAFASKYPEARNGHPCGTPGTTCPFGAAGVNVKLGHGIFDGAVEAAVNDVGKPAVLAVAWVEPAPKFEIIPSFRYYSPKYDNPYARGESATDEYLGNRARDELGPRLRLLYRPLRLFRVLLDVDFYRKENEPIYDPDTGQLVSTVNSPTWDFRGLFRMESWPTEKEHVVAWFFMHDRNLAKGGRGLTYEATSPDTAGGMRFSYALQASTSRPKGWHFAVQFKHSFEDTATFSTKFDKSFYIWGRVRASLFKGSSLSLRVKYSDEYTDTAPSRSQNRRYCEDEDTSQGSLAGLPVPDECRGESYVSVYLQGAQRLLSCCQVKLRAEWQRFTDARAKWRPLDPDEPVPTRNEVLIKGYFVGHF